MDEKLMAWARAVKARRSGRRPWVPPLWIFSDLDRLPDPRLVLARLPKGLCGLVWRPGPAPDMALGVAVARLCRERRVTMVVAGTPGMAIRLRAGRHLARGRQGCPRGFSRGGGLVTASAHGWRELVRARRLGADAVFLSPVFATASHPGARALGVGRWAALARRHSRPVLALGGITAATARRLPRFCAGSGVVGAAGGVAFVPTQG